MNTSPHHLGDHDQHTPEAAAMPLAAGRGVPGSDRFVRLSDFYLTSTGCLGRCMTAHSRGIGQKWAASKESSRG